MSSLPSSVPPVSRNAAQSCVSSFGNGLCSLANKIGQLGKWIFSSLSNFLSGGKDLGFRAFEGTKALARAHPYASKAVVVAGLLGLGALALSAGHKSAEHKRMQNPNPTTTPGTDNI